jgi:NAD+ synthase (glutamine-hydrolysing)
VGADPPSSTAALAGATVLLNLSGSPITVARADDRHLLAKSQSFRCNAAYVYAAAGLGESTNDVSWDGQTMIYESGALLAETERFPDAAQRRRRHRPRPPPPGPAAAGHVRRQPRAVALRASSRASWRSTSTAGIRHRAASPARPLPLRARRPGTPRPGLLRGVQHPGVRLEQRMRAIGSPRPVIGVSGGLDSTHALLVVARAMDRMGRPRSDILAYTMPGFATSDHTKSNAIALAEAIGATIETIDIRPMATELLTGIGTPSRRRARVRRDVRERAGGARTDFLFRLANQNGGFVVGTSDLSELALGWATYGVGDQMSHYAVNAGCRRRSSSTSSAGSSHTPTTPAAGREGRAAGGARHRDQPRARARRSGRQGAVDRGHHRPVRAARFRPVPRAALRAAALEDRVPRRAGVGGCGGGRLAAGFPDPTATPTTAPTIVRWLRVFLTRYFGFAQFKRTAIPNGPKVLPAGSLSPRGDWRAPSDGNADVWLAELDAALPDLIT